jgi:hypothetical protein
MTELLVEIKQEEAARDSCVLDKDASPEEKKIIHNQRNAHSARISRLNAKLELAQQKIDGQQMADKIKAKDELIAKQAAEIEFKDTLIEQLTQKVIALENALKQPTEDFAVNVATKGQQFTVLYHHQMHASTRSMPDLPNTALLNDAEKGALRAGLSTSKPTDFRA